ncbi:origin recognition complex subunit 3 N-terminus-domain-containing protein [Aspergillus avenaceus]|uniref:Origin recognition complex subunit 3 N-terminus-domain-containing protein n=1 Tax=Aspergillus avenaceus TaxID=36643 RepID=A0A5N6TFP7_ASPAV|nr:origin recognition complex subunit 3 N-terminus-domain-containing protein [Aspergillus avenaceus]
MDLETDIQATTKDGTNTQGVYIYRPANASKPHGERPSKRRKVQTDRKDQVIDSTPFVPLLNGDENETSVQLRYNAYQQLWSEQQAKIQEILDDVDSDVLDNVSSFVRSTSPQTYDGCIPTALVTVGSNVSSLGRLLAKLNNQLTTAEQGGVVVLESGDAPNLKTTLKNIIRAAIANTEGNDGYQNFLTDREGPRLLGYDLDLLGDYVKRKGLKKLVVAFRDSEAFDPNILTDLLSLLSSWLDRIPFSLLFGISTSVELFEGRLPRSSVALLRGKYFEIHGASNCVDRIYERLQAEPTGRFWIGRGITGVLFEKSNDFFQTPEAFSRTVKYAYMMHFFANPVSVLLSDEASKVQREPLCEAIRNLPSFRRFCEQLLDDDSAKQVRQLLEDNEFLFQQSLDCLRNGQQRMRNIFQAVKMIHTCLKNLNTSKSPTISALSIRALSGELLDSTFVDDVLKMLKTQDSSKLTDLFEITPQSLTDTAEFQKLLKDFEALTQVHQGKEPLRSEYDSLNSTVATTVVQQRVRLSKGKTKMSQQNIDYTKIIDRFHALLEGYFVETLVKPQDLPLHEAFLLDMRNPLKEVFSPRPRFAIERALASPFDYLISTSEKTDSRISAQQPATAVLYQLYLESGALVNVHDLWQAFYAVFESEQGDACDERMVMALFYRAVSELKVLGMLKTSRKKVDHAAKTAWVGL